MSMQYAMGVSLPLALLPFNPLQNPLQDPLPCAFSVWQTCCLASLSRTPGLQYEYRIIIGV